MIMKKRPTLTLKPSFRAFLDEAAKNAEHGNTVRFNSAAESLNFIRHAPTLDFIEEHGVDKAIAEGHLLNLSNMTSAERRKALFGDDALPYDKDRAERTNTNTADIDDPFVQSMLAADATIFDDEDDA